MVTAQVGKMPGRLVSVALEDGSTVAQALNEAQLDATGFEIRVDDEPASLTDVLQDGALVALVRPVKSAA